MNKSQLFKEYPSKDLSLNIIQSFGLNDFDDDRSFTKDDIVRLNTIEKISALKSELMKCYLPCKQRTYLNDLNTKNVITILRHVAKCYNYCIASTEKHVKKQKLIIYKITKISDKEYKPLYEGNTLSKDGYIEFD